MLIKQGDVGPFDPEQFFRIQVHTFTMNTKAYPLYRWLKKFNEGRLQPNLIFGFGMMYSGDLDISAPRSFMLRMGGGFEYFVAPKWAGYFDATYVLPFGNLEGLEYTSLSFGLQYHFE